MLLFFLAKEARALAAASRSSEPSLNRKETKLLFLNKEKTQTISLIFNIFIKYSKYMKCALGVWMHRFVLVPLPEQQELTAV